MLTVISYEVQELSNTKLFVVAKICNFVSNNEYICVFYFLEKTHVDELCRCTSGRIGNTSHTSASAVEICCEVCISTYAHNLHPILPQRCSMVFMSGDIVGHQNVSSNFGAIHGRLTLHYFTKWALTGMRTAGTFRAVPIMHSQTTTLSMSILITHVSLEHCPWRLMAHTRLSKWLGRKGEKHLGLPHRMDRSATVNHDHL